MIWQSWTIVVALLGPVEQLDCSLQVGADWSPSSDAVSAVVCRSQTGFFVPSKLYRELRDPTLSPEYRLLDAELRISNRIVDELKSLDGIRTTQVADLRTDAEMYRRRYLEGLDREAELHRRAVEASTRSWYESPILWMGIGIAATVTVVVLAKPRDRSE